MKGLLSGYNIYPSCIDEAQNAKVLCLFETPAYLDLLFFVQYAFFSDHSTLSGLVRGELMPYMVDQ